LYNKNGLHILPVTEALESSGSRWHRQALMLCPPREIYKTKLREKQGRQVLAMKICTLNENVKN